MSPHRIRARARDVGRDAATLRDLTRKGDDA